MSHVTSDITVKESNYGSAFSYFKLCFAYLTVLYIAGFIFSVLLLDFEKLLKGLDVTGSSCAHFFARIGACVRDSTNVLNFKRLVMYAWLNILSILHALPQKDTFELQVSEKVSGNG